MYKQYRHKDTDIYLREGKISQLRLLQSGDNKPYPLSQFFSREGKVACAINAGFFHIGRDGNYVLGRSQGDEYQATYHDKYNGKYCDFVVQGDEVKVGKFNSWDYGKSVCGYSPLAILVKDGVDCELYSEPLDDEEEIVAARNPRTAIVITNDKRVVFVKNDGRASNQRGLTGLELRDFLKEHYSIKDLVINDGGGSGEFIDEGKIIGGLSDGKERGMLVALAMLEEPPFKDIELKYPCAEGWDSNPYAKGHRGIDLGWIKIPDCNIYACADGIVEFEGFYDEVIKGRHYKPIGVIIRHPQFSDNYDLVSIYWHLSKTVIDKGMKVKEGDLIGNKGATGFTDPPNAVHLHFQLIKIPKGAEVPPSYKWADISIDPTPLLRVHEGQIFDYSGNFYIKKKGEK